MKLIAPDKRELSSYIAWSREPGDNFVPGGPLEVEISAGSERVARLAIGYLAAHVGWFRVNRDDPTPTGHFGVAMDGHKDIGDEGIGLVCNVEVSLQVDGFGRYSARLPLQIRKMENGICVAELGELQAD